VPVLRVSSSAGASRSAEKGLVVRRLRSTASSPAGSGSSSTTMSRSSGTVTRRRTRTTCPSVTELMGRRVSTVSYQRSTAIPSSRGV
jgi:hypothetical protein